MTSFLALCVTVLVLPQDPPPAKTLPKVGDRAPALQFDHLIGKADLAGKVVVLEFSTSWCAGCRMAAPHWNRLAKEMASEAITFLTVTNEDKATAERCAGELAIPALAVDLDGSLFEAFATGGVPDVVVIGADGHILGYSHPAKLDVAQLRLAIAGKPAKFEGGLPRADRSWNHNQVITDDIAPGTLLVRPCPKPTGMVKMDPKTGAISAGGVPITALFATVLDCPVADLDVDEALKTKTLYDLRARGTDDTVAGTRSFARERLAAELGVAVTTTMVEGKALLLRRGADQAALPAPDATRKGGSVRAGAMQFGSTTAPRLANALRGVLGAPVFDETALTEPFALDLQWDPQQGMAGLREALAKLGFTLEEGKRASPRHKLAPRT